MRKFEKVWQRLERNEEVVLVIPEKGYKVIRAGIYDEKYKRAQARRAVDLPAFGRINIVREPAPNKPGFLRLTVTISYNGEKL